MIINLWNSLPQVVVMDPSIDSFYGGEVHQSLLVMLAKWNLHIQMSYVSEHQLLPACVVSQVLLVGCCVILSAGLHGASMVQSSRALLMF